MSGVENSTISWVIGWTMFGRPGGGTFAVAFIVVASVSYLQ